MQIISNLSYVTFFEGIRILPGSSKLSEEDYEKFKEHPIFISKKLDGYFQVEEKFSSLSEMTPKNAIDFVKNSIDLDFLTSELSKEKRKAVKSEIDKRLFELNLDSESSEFSNDTEEKKSA
ncbi:hypothetical protein [Fluviispira vulneris]|uniref:hypothetical protein n=1 Tax=Fluviispira vulneris TaxID=2763012 RepID=UPI001647A9B2|nr:hypothetical protein [Fluviispira vulneris]